MKNVIINGVTYNDVPYVAIPLAEGEGEASFYDTSSGDVAAADVRAGKKAWANGVEVTGNVAERTQTDVAVNGKTVTVPAGIYDEQVQTSVATGSATPSASVVGDEIGDTQTDYSITITPSAAVGTPGYITSISDGATITKYIQTETKTVTPSTSQQDITPTSGKLLSSVKVNAVSLTGTAQPSDVLAGKTFYNTSLEKVTGTATVPSVSQNDITKALMIS